MPPLLAEKKITVSDHAATGARLRKRREKAKLSLREVARRMSLSAPYLSDLELGRRAWTEAKAKAFCRALR